MSNIGPDASTVRPFGQAQVTPTASGSNTTNISAVSPPSLASSTPSPVLPPPVFASAVLPSVAPGGHASAQTLPPALFFQQRADLLRTILPQAHDDSIVDPKRQESDFTFITSWSDLKDIPENDLPDRVSFLQDAMGDPVDGTRIKQIRDDLRNVFTQICMAMRSALCKKWSDYDATFKNTIIRHLRIRYPEFTYCDDDWKANSFISNFYSNWHRNLKDKEKRAERKRAQALEASQSGRQSKRCRRESAKTPATRQRHGVGEPSGSVASSSQAPGLAMSDQALPAPEAFSSQPDVIIPINPLYAYLP